MEEENRMNATISWLDFYSDLGSINFNAVDDDSLDFMCSTILCFYEDFKLSDLVLDASYTEYREEYLTVFTAMIHYNVKLRNSFVKFWDGLKSVPLDLKAKAQSEIINRVVKNVMPGTAVAIKKIISVLLCSEVDEGIRESVLRFFRKCEGDLVELADSYDRKWLEEIVPSFFEDFKKLMSYSFAAGGIPEDKGNLLKKVTYMSLSPFVCLRNSFRVVEGAFKSEQSFYSKEFMNAILRCCIYLFVAEYCNTGLQNVLTIENVQEEDREFLDSSNLAFVLGSVVCSVYGVLFSKNLDLLYDVDFAEFLKSYYEVFLPIGKEVWNNFNRGLPEDSIFKCANLLGFDSVGLWQDPEISRGLSVLDKESFRRALTMVFLDGNCNSKQDLRETFLSKNDIATASKLAFSASLFYRFFAVCSWMNKLVQDQNLQIVKMDEKLKESVNSVSRETSESISSLKEENNRLASSLAKANSEIESLQKMVKAKQDSLNKVSLDLERMQNKYSRLKESMENSRLSAELSEREVAASVAAFVPEEDTVSLSELAAELNTYRGIFVGGNPNLTKKLSEFLNWVIVDKSQGPISSDRMRGKDVIAVYSDSLGHSTFMKVQSVSQQGVPLIYVHGTSLRILLKNLLDEVRKVFC